MWVLQKSNPENNENTSVFIVGGSLVLSVHHCISVALQ